MNTCNLMSIQLTIPTLRDAKELVAILKRAGYAASSEYQPETGKHVVTCKLNAAPCVTFFQNGDSSGGKQYFTTGGGSSNIGMPRTDIRRG